VFFDDIRIEPLAEKAASKILTISGALPDQTGPRR
jgi:hypothetical protein